MLLRFLGATKTVTGSKYLIETDKITALVDCGLYQGYKELRLRNWNPFPIDPKEIDYVILTHAHIDHSGYIPLLVKHGFGGRIICTEATYDLCRILLPDSGHLQEEEARYANKKGSSKHHPALPLYTREDAEHSLDFFQTAFFNEEIVLENELKVSFHYGAHILGAAFVKIEAKSTSLLFSGDLGRAQDAIMYPPDNPVPVDYLILESTYGDRLHTNEKPEDTLAQVINRTAKRGGNVVIPSFAVGRAQHILYYIYQLKKQNRIPSLQVYIDSPMSTDATKIFYKYNKLHQLTKSESLEVCRTAKYVQTVEESIELDNQKYPIIIISASGMVTGGRVLHHVKNLAPDHKNSIVFCGYQAGGTRGDRILKGEKKIKIFGEMVPVRAEVVELTNTSAHADYFEMISWLSHLKKTPKKVFITHGEEESAQALKQKLEKKFGWKCKVPDYLDEEKL